MEERAYFDWLIATFVKKSRWHYHGKYSCLLEQMFRKAYYAIVDYDDNRAEDGLYLRDTFLETYPEKDMPVPGGPCSFLEFLIGVSIRLEEIMIDGEALPVYLYFWELMDRLRLTEYTDVAYSQDSAGLMVDLLMTDFMDRTYSRNGEGGLFPLRRTNKDQTKVEVWYQLNAYLIENPDFFDR